MADWEDIKRLAADFQRTQTTDTLQRLSERNCIDIVKKLTELSLIELIYTCDGEEFITPQHLLKEVEDATYVNGGRIQIHDLASDLNVDYQHVENAANELVRNKPEEYSVILGQIIHETYKKTLSKQILDTMMTDGQLSIGEFSKALDLPSEYLVNLVKDILPQISDDFVASPDGRTFYSSDIMDRYKSIISGTLSAITKPTPLANIIKRLDVPEKMFDNLTDSLIKSGRLDASIESRQYIPAIHAREQNDWIDKFYATNSYIDYDVLTRRGIKQAKTFLKKRFADGTPLKGCFVSPMMVAQVESLIEDCVASNSLMDIALLLPGSLQPDDIETMLRDLFKTNKNLSSRCLIMNQTNLCSLGYIEMCKKSFKDMMGDRAKEHLKEGKLINHFLGGKLKTEPKRGKKDTSAPEANPSEVDQKEDKSNTSAKETAKGKEQIVGQSNEAAEETTSKEEKSQDSKAPAAAAKGRKSGGGTQGREIKQRVTKNKYRAGKNRDEDEDDNASAQTRPGGKAPRSLRGRAARQAAENFDDDEMVELSKPKKKENPLEFMSSEELVNGLRQRAGDAGEVQDEVLESVACSMMVELNRDYEKLARSVLDEHLRKSADSESATGNTKKEARSDDRKDCDDYGDEDDDSVDLVE